MKKRKGRYQHTSPNKANNRKYTSYEDVPLREYKDSDPVPNNLTKKFLKVFLVVFLSVVALLALTNLNYLTPDNISHWIQYDLLGKTEGEGYPVKYNGTLVSPGNFSIMDKAPVYCSDTSIVVLNSNAGEYQNRQHAFANPILKTTPSCSIVYNSDASSFKLLNRNNITYNGTADKKILDADISTNGSYGLLTSGSDYLSELSVYKSDNTKKYSYSFADYYINKVSVNGGGTRAALSGLSAKNGSVVSVIYVLDFSQENYMQKYEVEDSYIYDVCYLDNDNVLAVGNTAAYHINVDNGKKTMIPYKSRTLTTYCFSKSYGLLLSLSANPDGRDCDIVAVNGNGEKETTVSTDSRIVSLDYKNNKITALIPSEIRIYDLEGKQLTSMKVASDAKKACMSDNNTLYILGTSNISKLDVEYK